MNRIKIKKTKRKGVEGNVESYSEYHCNDYCCIDWNCGCAFMKGHVDYKIEPFHKFFNLLELGFFKICDKIGASKKYFDLKKSEEVQNYQPELGWTDVVEKGHKKAAR